MPLLALDDSALHYRVHTASSPCAGPALVLVHGAGGNLMHWPGELRRLPGHTVFALDLPGHGRSGQIGGPSRDSSPSGLIGAYAQIVRRFAEELSLGKFVVAGHSMGGAIAQELALQSPERLAGLVLVASAAKLPVTPDLMNMLLDDQQAAANALTSWAQGANVDGSTMRIYLQRLREVDPVILYRDYAACSAWDRTADLGRVRVPTLVICGDADRMIPLRLSMDLQQGIKSARLVVVPGAGHMVMLEQAALVAREVQRFLAELPPAYVEDLNTASGFKPPAS
jgi:pimeloyl-ACP methyl ester carboxylesterase